MTLENQEIETNVEEITPEAEISTRDAIEAAYEKMEGEKEEIAPKKHSKKAVKASEDNAALSEHEAGEDVATPEPERKESIPAPQGLSAVAKAKWNELPPEIQAEWAKRENDIHQVLTRHDGDLRLGREIKEAVAPYMATIQAEGYTPTQAIAGILKNDHFLRTASPQAKLQKFYEMATHYGVPIEQPEQPYEDPVIAELRKEIASLREVAKPDVALRMLQQQQEDSKFMTELEAFASDPANVYFDRVRPVMAALYGNNSAKSLKEAYDMACHADPEIRSTLAAKQEAEKEAKRKQELEAKRKAGLSITGSSGVTTPSSTSQPKSTREAVLAAYDAVTSAAI